MSATLECVVTILIPTFEAGAYHDETPANAQIGAHMSRFGSTNTSCSEDRPSARSTRRCRWLIAFAAAALVSGACTGADDDEGATDGGPASAAPSVVVTTGIWADVVASVGCDDSVTVTTIIPPGGDPHTFEPSLRDRESMEDAALVVSNGLALEESILDTLEAVAQAGVPMFEFGDHVDTIEFDLAAAHGHGHGDAEDDHDEGEDGDDHDEGEEDDDHSDEDAEEEGDDHDEGEDGEEGDDHHEEGGADPHIWFDLQQVANALPDLADALIAAGADASTVRGCLEDYRTQMVAADAEIIEIVGEIPPERRILVTNHESLGYFADRYGFEIVGTVIPANTTAAASNPAALADLAEIIEHEGVVAVFSETTSADDDAQALATAAGDIAVVPLLTGSLAPPGDDGDTLIGLLLHNARTIVDALAAGSADGGQ